MATSSHGVAINHSSARSIIEQFTGILSCEEISQKLGIPITTIKSIIDEMVYLVGLDAYKRMIDTLARNTDSDLSQLITHLQQNNWDAIFSQAHKVQGAAGLMGLS